MNAPAPGRKKAVRPRPRLIPRSMRGSIQLLVVRAARGTLKVVGGVGTGKVVEAAAKILRSTSRLRADVHPGRTMEVPLADGYWVPTLLGRDYEPEVKEVLGRELNPDAAFIDCGANLGYWSLYASTIISDPTRIVAIEASPFAFAELRRNSELNGDCFTSVLAAVWRYSGDTIEFTADPVRHAWGTAANELSDRLMIGGFRSIETATTTIDEVCTRWGQVELRGTTIKLDVEGSELDALEGARRTLEAGCLVIFERHERDREDAAANLLRSLGYSITPLTHKGRATRNYLASRWD